MTSYKDIMEAMEQSGKEAYGNLDMVNEPPHYNTAGIECIEAMEAMVEGAEIPAHQAYCWQTVFKYIWRWPYKHRDLEDLKKAKWYLERLIEKRENA